MNTTTTTLIDALRAFFAEQAATATVGLDPLVDYVDREHFAEV